MTGICTRAVCAGPRRAIAALLPVLFMLTLISGCGAEPSRIPDKIVVVASATANEPGPVLATGDRSLLSAAAAASASAIAYVVNTRSDQPTTVPLTPLRPDGQVQYGPDRSALITQNVNRVQRLLDGEAATGPFDLLSLIAAAVRVTSAPATLIVLSSGLSTAGAFDLRQVGWAASPTTVAAELKRTGLLPTLAGWKVVFSGLGETTGHQPTLPLPQQTTLTAYWMTICRAAGAASCTTDAATRPDPVSRSTIPVPVVPVPAVTSVSGPHGATGISVPAEEFFAFDSARLLPGADAILGLVAARARARHLLVSITGYASPEGGTAAYNNTLSAARAQAVQSRLIILGVSAAQITHVAGAGTSGATVKNCYRRGRLDETACAALRRVVILLTPQPAVTS